MAWKVKVFVAVAFTGMIKARFKAKKRRSMIETASFLVFIAVIHPFLAVHKHIN